jgi:hypothetical protein
MRNFFPDKALNDVNQINKVVYLADTCISQNQILPEVSGEAIY